MADVAADIIELAHVIDDLVLDAADTSELEFDLADRLYRLHYCRPSQVSALLGAPPARDLVAALSNANGGSGTMDSGWTLIERREGVCIVQKHGVSFWIAPDQVSETDGQIRVAVPKEMNSLIPGFYFLFGNTVDESAWEERRIARFYWHVTEAGAAAFVDALSTTLNDAHIPFTAKVVRHPGAFLRADAGVLYLNRRLVAGAMDPLRKVYEQIRPWLRATTPMFALRMAPGLAVADDPGDHSSFGQHRCRLIASGLLAALRNGHSAREERLAHVIRSLESEGVCPANPHLRNRDAEPYSDFFGLG